MEVISSFFNNIKSKFTNPFFGTLTLVLIIHHWELIFMIFNFDKLTKLNEKLSEIDNYINNNITLEGFLCDMLKSLLIMFLGYLVVILTRSLVLWIEYGLIPAITGKIINKNVYFYLNLSNYLNPKFILNSSLVAENFYLNGEYDKAKKILSIFDKKYEFYYWFRVKKEAQIIIKEKGYEEGIDYLSSKFSKIKNPNEKMVFDVANFYKNSKNYERAIEYYTKIISSLDDNSEIKSDLLYRRGGSYERLGDYQKADEDLKYSLKINPDDAYVLNYLAYSWLERDYKIDQAMEMLEKAYALRSNDPYITDSIGWAYYLIDNFIEAEKYIKKAVELMPEDPTVNDHYGDILWKLNRNIQARYFWNYVLSLDDADEDIKKKINIKIIEGLHNS